MKPKAILMLSLTLFLGVGLGLAEERTHSIKAEDYFSIAGITGGADGASTVP